MESVSSSSGSSKRARAPAGGSQVASCLVDGCKADLSKCRDYQRRHKVCELHSKTPKVTIRGQEQRFCQQCSRFHSLGEFDEGKRSCRKRLEGHNRRRRKPQPDSLPLKPGNFFPNGKGSSILSFSSSPIIPASSVVRSTWSGAVKAKSNPAVYSNHSQLCMVGEQRSFSGSSYSHPYRGRQFPFLRGLSSALPGSSSGTATESNSSSNHPDEFSNSWLNPGIDSALSLLSSSLAGAPEIGPNRLVQSNPVPQVRATNLIAGLHHTGADQLPSSFPQLHGSNTMSNSTSLHHCQDGFQAGSDGSYSADGRQQTLSFLWE